jgi:hypothetical protein
MYKLYSIKFNSNEIELIKEFSTITEATQYYHIHKLSRNRGINYFVEYPNKTKMWLY